MTDKNDTEVDDRLDEERMCFNKKIKYNNEIIKFLLSDQKVFGKNYELKAIINTPRIDHYNSIIIKLNKLCYNLELGNTQIYDSNKNSNLIIKVKNLTNILNKIYPYIWLFMKAD